MEELFERLVELRKYRKLKQEECAEWFGISGASYGRKEKGSEGGLGPKEIQRILDETRIDARWLFGQLQCPIDEADLKRQEIPMSTVELIRKETERLNEIKKGKADDPLAHRVMIDQLLRGIVEKIARLDRPTMQALDAKFDFVEGLVSPYSGMDKKESHAS